MEVARADAPPGTLPREPVDRVTGRAHRLALPPPAPVVTWAAATHATVAR